MKKHLLGIAAVILAVSLSAFTNKEKFLSKKLQTDYWFIVTVAKNTGTGTNSFTNADVMYSGATDPGGCSGAGKYCNADFSAGQVNIDSHGVVTLSGTQAATSFDVKN